MPSDPKKKAKARAKAKAEKLVAGQRSEGDLHDYVDGPDFDEGSDDGEGETSSTAVTWYAYGIRFPLSDTRGEPFSTLEKHAYQSLSKAMPGYTRSTWGRCKRWVAEEKQKEPKDRDFRRFVCYFNPMKVEGPGKIYLVVHGRKEAITIPAGSGIVVPAASFPPDVCQPGFVPSFDKDDSTQPPTLLIDKADKTRVTAMLCYFEGVPPPPPKR